MTQAAPCEAPAPSAQLPRLRSDIVIEVIHEHDSPFISAIVTDPLRATYYRLAWPESAVVLAWQQATTSDALMQRLAIEMGARVSSDEVKAVVAFAQANQLTQPASGGDLRRLAILRANRKRGMASTALQSCLFFRIPLVRPDRALTRILPVFAFAYTRTFWILVGVCALLDIHLAMRAWPAFLASAGQMLQLQALAIYAAALFVLKAVHELGHALTTVRLGCRVPSMGIAVMLGAPVLYTDTTDSWRLPRRADRLSIVFAGVAAECVVATLAMLAWAFLDDGPLRQTCFALATASLLLTFLVNLNPCMRFDGYFALSDYLRVPNLQSRAFALGCWRLRESLFDLRHHPPEVLPFSLARTLVLYAGFTAIYRFFLFLGIAAMIYVIAGKAIGTILGAIEIGIFIARPVWGEFATWWSFRTEIVKRRRSWLTASVFVVAVTSLFVPWISTIEVPAVMMAEQEEAVYLPIPARLKQVRVANGQQVRAGEVMFVASSPDLVHARQRADLKLRALAAQIERLHANERERPQRIVLVAMHARVAEEIAATTRQLQQLTVRAPFDGRVVDLDPDLAPGQWINPKHKLAHVAAEPTSLVRGLIAEANLARVREGANGMFVSDDAIRPSVAVTLAKIRPASDGRLFEPMLADVHGGLVNSAPAQTLPSMPQLVARNSHFEAIFAAVPGKTSQVVRGVVRLEANAVSPATLMWRAMAKVLVREQTF